MNIIPPIDRRTGLIDVLPLRTPFSLFFSPATTCNFRCEYCYNSVPGVFPADERRMPFDVFRKAIDDAERFPDRLRSVTLVGFGEPLLNPDLVNMVAYATRKEAADIRTVFTNGLLLNREMSDRLIDAGVNRLTVSIQGLNSADYKRICGVALDFEELTNQIRYFFERKGSDCILRAKILDIGCSGEENVRRFHEIFDSITDFAHVEHYAPMFPSKGLKTYRAEENRAITGAVASDVGICPFPFYMLSVWPSGNVGPCGYFKTPIVFGNLKKTSLREIWNSESRRSFLLGQIGGRKVNPTCVDCLQPVFDKRQGNDLDPYRKELRTIYEESG